MFWRHYAQKTQRDKDELISSTINKVDAYLNEPMIANIVSQSKTTIDFRRIMDEGKILLVNLSPQLEEMSRLIGATLIGKLLMAAFSRTEDQRQAAGSSICTVTDTSDLQPATSQPATSQPSSLKRANSESPQHCLIKRLHR
jgi:hypothetical protein